MVRIVKLHEREKEGEGWGDAGFGISVFLCFLLLFFPPFFSFCLCSPCLKGVGFSFFTAGSRKGCSELFQRKPNGILCMVALTSRNLVLLKNGALSKKKFSLLRKETQQNDRVRGKCRICNNNVAFCLTDGPNSNYYAVQD